MQFVVAYPRNFAVFCVLSVSLFVLFLFSFVCVSFVCSLSSFLERCFSSIILPPFMCQQIRRDSVHENDRGVGASNA